MIDEERDLDQPWEPITFYIGDVVRVSVGGECRHIITDTDPRDEYHRIIEHMEGHPRIYHNRLAMIIHIYKNTPHGHNYRVAFLSPVALNNNESSIVADFAAIELEKVDRTVTPDEWKNIEYFTILTGHPYPSTEKN